MYVKSLRWDRNVNEARQQHALSPGTRGERLIHNVSLMRASRNNKKHSHNPHTHWLLASGPADVYCRRC